MLSFRWWAVLLMASGACLLPAWTVHASPLDRSLTLPRGVLRVDLAPSDYGFMDHGALNNQRGFRVQEAGDPSPTRVLLGTGLAYGVARNFELGTLILPLQLSPDTDVGDLEFYGRYGLSSAVALQLTLQLPTETDLGLGFGVPVHLRFGRGHRVETGVELEVMFANRTTVNLDVPLALQFRLAQAAYVGLRSGFFYWQMEEIGVNLGAQAGVSLSRGIDLSAGFNFPWFLSTRPEHDSINVDLWEVILGLTFFVGL